MTCERIRCPSPRPASSRVKVVVATHPRPIRKRHGHSGSIYLFQTVERDSTSGGQRETRTTGTPYHGDNCDFDMVNPACPISPILLRGKLRGTVLESSQPYLYRAFGADHRWLGQT